MLVWQKLGGKGKKRGGYLYLSAMMDSMRGVSWKNPISPGRRRNRENEGLQSGTKKRRRAMHVPIKSPSFMIALTILFCNPRNKPRLPMYMYSQG